MALQRASDGFRDRLEIRIDDTESGNAALSDAGLRCAVVCEVFVFDIDECEAGMTICDAGVGRLVNDDVGSVRDKEVCEEDGCD
jgi:hypothetical protein